IADIPTKGYYASSLDDLDPTGSTHDVSLAIIDWDEDNCASAPSGTYSGTCKTASPKVAIKDPSGKNVIGSAKYLIARLCSAPGSPTGVDAGGKPIVCSKPPTAGTSTAEGRGEIGGKSYMRPDVTVVGPYYRIVVRAVGGRNTVSSTETIVHC